MIITIHQPDFMPWLGFFDRWRKSDLYIVLDDVQFIRRGWHHRDKIKTQHGVKWLTVPVKTKGKYSQLIKDVELDNDSNWQHKHLATINAAYSQAQNFNEIFPEIERVYTADHDKLINLNMSLLELFADIMGINTPVKYSSDIDVPGTKTNKLINLAKACNGKVYLTGRGSKDYLEEDVFRKEGIQVQWQSFEHPNYMQLHGKFKAGLSALDYLMMEDNYHGN